MSGGPVGEYFYRPDLDPANARVRSWVYLLCLDPPYLQAEHYTGSATDLWGRLAVHGTSAGARLLEVQRLAGGSWHLVRTWPGGRYEERAIKGWKQGPRLCPDCSPGTRRGSLADVARAAARARWNQARRYAGAGPEPDGEEVLAGYAARGREDALRFLSIRRGATADEIEQAAAGLQTPYYEGCRTPSGDAEQGAFAAVVLAELERLRESEPPHLAGVVRPAAHSGPAAHGRDDVAARSARRVTSWVSSGRLVVRAADQLEAGA